MKQLAIIKDVGFGCRDVGYPVLFFNTMLSEGSGALQVLSGQDAISLIKAYGCYEIKNMEGKPIWVNIDGNKITVAEAWVE